MCCLSWLEEHNETWLRYSCAPLSPRSLPEGVIPGFSLLCGGMCSALPHQGWSRQGGKLLSCGWRRDFGPWCDRASCLVLCCELREQWDKIKKAPRPLLLLLCLCRCSPRARQAPGTAAQAEPRSTLLELSLWCQSCTGSSHLRSRGWEDQPGSGCSVVALTKFPKRTLPSPSLSWASGQWLDSLRLACAYWLLCSVVVLISVCCRVSRSWGGLTRVALNVFQAHLPFAVIGSTEELKIGNKMMKARQYPWGTVQGESRPGIFHGMGGGTSTRRQWACSDKRSKDLLVFNILRGIILLNPCVRPIITVFSVRKGC